MASKDTHHNYAWLQLPQFRDRVFIIEQYSPQFCDYLVHRDVPPHSTLIFMDDWGVLKTLERKIPASGECTAYCSTSV